MNNKRGERLAVLGAGAWGTALAIEAHRSGCDVTLWARDAKQVEQIQHDRQNKRCLPGIQIDPAIDVTAELDEALEAHVLLLAVPAQTVRDFCEKIREKITASKPLIVCAKGIEQTTLMLMSEVVESVLPQNPVAILSGPNFADEVAKGLPAATTLACTDRHLGEELIFLFQCPMFRAYLSQDIIGAQIGGAVKNVLAIACGIAAGKGFGENARAALITRGLAEMIRLCKAKGGKKSTLMGLSGIGDLMLTCMSKKSRNTSLGMALGQGKNLKDILAGQQGVSEGVATAQSVVGLARALKVEMPICEAVNAILHQGAGIDDTISSLLHRPVRSEI